MLRRRNTHKRMHLHITPRPHTQTQIYTLQHASMPCRGDLVPNKLRPESLPSNVYFASSASRWPGASGGLSRGRGAFARHLRALEGLFPRPAQPDLLHVDPDFLLEAVRNSLQLFSQRRHRQRDNAKLVSVCLPLQSLVWYPMLGFSRAMGLGTST